MIIAYVGLAGSGKTYHMTRTALSLIRRNEIVFSRHELEGAYPLVDEREMLRMRDCHCFFDEWHQDHSAKEWWHMDEVLKHIITQSRKYGITIHWSAQHWLYMDSFIRRNTDWCWRHRALFRDADTGTSRIGLHRAEKVSGLSEELKHRRPETLAKRWIWISQKVYSQYDSYKPMMISKEKLTDEQIAAIKDPYTREAIHLSANHAVDRHAYLVTDQDTFNSEPDSQNYEESIKRQDEANNLSPSMEVVDP